MGMSNRHRKRLARMKREQKAIEFYARPDGLPAPYERRDGFVRDMLKSKLIVSQGAGGSLKGKTMPAPIGVEVFTEPKLNDGYTPRRSAPVFITRLDAKGKPVE